MQEKHNMSYTPEHRAWTHMKTRCNNKKSKDYIRYGGRGIKVCDEWNNSFKAFFSDMGYRPSNLHSLDRIDVNGNYCKVNCRWSTQKEQQNNRRNNVKFKGESSSVASVRLGGCCGMIYNRINGLGWGKKKAFTTPVIKQSIRSDMENGNVDY